MERQDTFVSNKAQLRQLTGMFQHPSFCYKSGLTDWEQYPTAITFNQ